MKTAQEVSQHLTFENRFQLHGYPTAACHMNQFRGERLPGTFPRSTDILGDAGGKGLSSHAAQTHTDPQTQ